MPIKIRRTITAGRANRLRIHPGSKNAVWGYCTLAIIELTCPRRRGDHRGEGEEGESRRNANPRTREAVFLSRTPTGSADFNSNLLLVSGIGQSLAGRIRFKGSGDARAAPCTLARVSMRPHWHARALMREWNSRRLGAQGGALKYKKQTNGSSSSRRSRRRGSSSSRSRRSRRR